MGFSVLRFSQFFRSVFRFWCSFRFADFSLFSIRFSVFVENNSGFSVLLSNVVFGFSYFESKWGFRFWPKFLAVLDDFFFGFAVSNIIYPKVPSVSNEEHSMMSSDWLRVALLLHALWHGKKRS